MTVFIKKGIKRSLYFGVITMGLIATASHALGFGRSQSENLVANTIDGMLAIPIAHADAAGGGGTTFGDGDHEGPMDGSDACCDDGDGDA